MRKTGEVNLPLHSGRAPAWLFQRMTRLAREIIVLIVSEFGPEKLLDDLSDPFWFQAFGCVLGFDWHSSGLTTTTCGAIKEGLRGLEKDLKLFAAGGKGATAMKTPQDIIKKAQYFSDRAPNLIYASKMSAKVDNQAVQDGYSLYQHSFFFTEKGQWAVIQQGMNLDKMYARRYHWTSRELRSFVSDPHKAICCDRKNKTLNLVSCANEKIRQGMVSLATEKPETVLGEYQKISRLELPARHPITVEDIRPANLQKVLLATYERRPADFEALLNVKGVGAKALRALALISELVFGTSIDYKDPVRFSFAHGGKDGYPFPVDKKTYDRSIAILHRAINKARCDRSEKIKAFERLSRFYYH
jgi:uncharacterized protein